MESLTLEERENFGQSFIEETRMHRKDAPMFTDKMPNNFQAHRINSLNNA